MKAKILLTFLLMFVLTSFVSAVNCIDSDGGKNYFEKGTITDNLCFEDGSCSPTYFTDYCMGSNKVYEAYCLDDESDWSAIEKVCDGGCVDGACKEGTVQDVPTEGTCTDSDGGINYNQKGRVAITGLTGNPSASDYCSDSPPGNIVPSGKYVVEYSCLKNSFLIFGTQVEGVMTYQQYECSYGCRDGVCLTQPAECSPYKEFPLFNRNSSYSLNGENYVVSIKESAQSMNTFDVTLNGITYSSKPYESSFSTGKGEKIFLGKPSATSTVMYTSIEFCMTSEIVNEDNTRAEQNNQEISEDEDSIALTEIQPKETFFKKILNWFKRLFGSN